MKTPERLQKEYDALKANVISDIWFSIKDRDGKALDIGERKGIPAIVTMVIDDQFSETIDELIVRENKVIAITSNSYDGVNEDDVLINLYDLNEFDVPFLIAIYDSVVKHIDLEEAE